MSLAVLDGPILYNIVRYCATSPMCQFNGIAVCSRRINIAWRHMHYALARSMLHAVIENLEPEDHYGALLVLHDLQDIF